jgi:hypothetical protein
MVLQIPRLPSIVVSVESLEESESYCLDKAGQVVHSLHPRQVVFAPHNEILSKLELQIAEASVSLVVNNLG